VPAQFRKSTDQRRIVAKVAIAVQFVVDAVRIIIAVR